ncbi:MAG: hypothetical protein ACLSA6_02475 [Holdemania massiliensis]
MPKNIEIWADGGIQAENIRSLSEAGSPLWLWAVLSGTAQISSKA